MLLLTPKRVSFIEKMTKHNTEKKGQHVEEDEIMRKKIVTCYLYFLLIFLIIILLNAINHKNNVVKKALC